MKLTLQLPDGRTAKTEGNRWESPDPRLGVFCTIATAKQAANYRPQAFLDAATRLAERLGGTLEIEGAVGCQRAEDTPSP